MNWNNMDIVFIYTLFFTLGVLITGTEAWFIKRRKDCKIPRGSLYDRATFRLQYGNSIDPLARGETVNQYNKVVVICKKDILTDVAMNYHVITCHRGRWKPNLPACADPKNCYSLRPVENATPEVLLGNTVDNPHGTVVRYTCNEGYSMEGNNERYCLNGEWSEVKFTCTIMQGPRNCSPLRPVENAPQTVLQGNTVDNPHGTVVRYTCNEGYSLEGNNERQCVNGVWSDVQFTCIRIQRPRNCSPLRPVENASFTVLRGNTVHNPHGTAVRYTCNEGYSLEGNNERQCVNGVWSDVQFSCIRIQRPRNCSPLRSEENASLMVLRGNTVDNPHGTVVRYTCNEGYSLEGNNERQCVNGVWSDVQFTCIRIQRTCESLQDKFQVVNDIGSVSNLQNGSVVRLRCRWSWFPKDGIREATCLNGKWRPKKPYCIVVCKIPNRPGRVYRYLSSGEIVRNRVANSETVMQRCLVGPANPSKSTCMNGRWRPSFKYCPERRRLGVQLRTYSIANCTVPDNPMAIYVDENGDRIGSLELVPDGAQVTQLCGDHGIAALFSETNSSFCHAGRWLPEFQNCSNNSSDDAEAETKCEKPYVKFATMYPDLEGYYIGETAVIHCHSKGVAMRENITCLESGEWSAANISCDACGSRKPDVKASEFNYFSRSKVKSKFVGYFGSITECASKCVSYTNFSCQSIQVFKYAENGSAQFYCKLLDHLTEENSDIFYSSSKTESAIYNVKCDTLEETKHCLQPKKVHMVYWPVKQLYEVNDSITILNCGDGLVHAGSHEMRCTQDGTWEGDFECLSPCKDGKPDIKSSNFNSIDLSAVEVKHVAWLDSVSECARYCIFDRNFSCKSIQVISREKTHPNKIYCKLLDQLADDASDRFDYFEDPRQQIYNVNCNDTCILSAEEGLTLTDLEGRKTAINGPVPDGTVLHLECNDRQKTTKKQTITCIAGKWNSQHPFCS